MRKQFCQIRKVNENTVTKFLIINNFFLFLNDCVLLYIFFSKTQISEPCIFICLFLIYSIHTVIKYFINLTARLIQLYMYTVCFSDVNTIPLDWLFPFIYLFIYLWATVHVK